MGCLFKERKLRFLKSLFSFFGKIFSFINNHFKALLFLLILYLVFGDGISQQELEKPNLVSIDIHGAIMDARGVLEKINSAKDDNSIQGVLLHVNSPGGALAPSVEISYTIKELRKAKPVVAYAAGTMASGSYYSSIWANKIFANPGAFIGSIGVILNSFNIKPLADKIGIEEQTIQAGKYKAAGTFMRPWSEDEKQSLEVLISSAYELFVKDVSEARGLDSNTSHTFADAKVFLAKNAQKVGLIDEVGTLEDAKEFLRVESGVKKAIWKKRDKLDMFLEKLSTEGTKTLLKLTSGLNAY